MKENGGYFQLKLLAGLNTLLFYINQERLTILFFI